MRVNEFMTTNVFTCNESQTVEDAATLMAEKNIGVVPIINNNEELVGVITEGDFITKNKNIPHALVSLRSLFGKRFHDLDIEDVYKEAKKKTLAEVMTKNPKTLNAQSALNDVVALMGEKDLKRVPVVDDNKKVVGIITRSNVIKAFKKL